LLLAVMLGSVYVLLLQVVLPNFFPVLDDQNLVMSSTEVPTAGQPLSIVRLSPSTKRISIVHGIVPPQAPDVQLPLSWQIGVPLDKTIEVTDAELTSKSDVVRVFKDLLGESTNSDFPLRQRISWWLFTRSIPRANVRIIEVESSSDWSAARRPLTDGRASQACPVAVLNTISKTGAASQLSQLLERTGLVVIRVGDTPDLKEVTEVVLDEASLNCQTEAEWIGQFVDTTATDSVKVSIEPGVFAQYRAPIILKIGRDLEPALDSLAQIEN
jgi:hypothetical protein